MSKDTAMEEFTLAELRRATQAAREFTVPVGPEGGGRIVNLRVPTEHEFGVASMRVGAYGQSDAAAIPLLQRMLLCAGVVAWSNIKQTDVLAGASDEALPLNPLAVELLLDAQPEWDEELGGALFREINRRRAVKAEAEKNS